MIGAGIVSIPCTQADTRITVPGAGPLYEPNFLTELPYLGQNYLKGGLPGPSSVSILQGYDLLNHAIGENWFPGSTAQVVDYPASIGILSGSLAAPTANEAVAMGQQELNDQIMNAVANGNGSPVDIAALSEGTIVVDRELAYLATDPSAPPADDLQFAMFSNPELGLAGTYLPVGITVPVVDYTVGVLPDTQYDVSVVFGQYDFWGDPPDRPWDLLADLNSVFGALYFHDATSLVAPSDAVELSSVTDSLGGTITTYMVPSSTLPMLLPLEQIGVPEQIVNDLNSVLQPIVNDGYSALTPDAGAYFSHGLLLGLPTAAGIVSSLESGLSLSAIASDIAALDVPGLFGPDGFSVLGADLANFSTLFGSDLVNLLGLIW
jgi:PE-PPE domain